MSDSLWNAVWVLAMVLIVASVLAYPVMGVLAIWGLATGATLSKIALTALVGLITGLVLGAAAAELG